MSFLFFIVFNKVLEFRYVEMLWEMKYWFSVCIMDWVKVNVLLFLKGKVVFIDCLFGIMIFDLLIFIFRVSWE